MRRAVLTWRTWVLAIAVALVASALGMIVPVAQQMANPPSPTEGIYRGLIVIRVAHPSGKLAEYKWGVPLSPESPWRTAFDELERAHREGRFYQVVRYLEHQAGFPFPALTYLQRGGSEFGIHSPHARAEELRGFSQSILLDHVGWTGLLADLCAWFSSALLATYVVKRIWFALKAWARTDPGLCINCGYDLRGCTCGTCSECGTPFDPQRLKVRLTQAEPPGPM